MHSSSARLPALLLAAAIMGAGAVLPGCAPSCAKNCRKVLFDCDLDSARVALDECEDSCLRQQALYRQWDNDELLDLFRDHRGCIQSSSCEEIADGVCYEGFEELFVFE